MSGEDQVIDTDAEAEGEVVDRLLSVLQAGADQEARLLLYQWEDTGYSYLDAIDAVTSVEALFSLTRSRYGPGKYQVRAVGTDGRFKASRVYRIAARPEDAPDPAPRPAAEADDRVARLEGMVRDLVAQMRAPSPARDASSELLASMLQSQAQMTQLVLGKMLDTKSERGADASALLDAFERGLAMAEDRGGSSTDRLAPLLATMLSRAAVPGAEAPAMIPPAGGDPLRRYLTAYAPPLLTAARRGLAPATVAQVVAAQLDDTPAVELLEARAEELPELLVGVAPALGDYRTWLRELRDALFPSTDDPE